MRILAEVTSGDAPAKDASVPRAHRAIADACRELVAKRLGERLSLGAIASAVGVSQFHLARLFRRDAGMTLHRYIHELRLRASLERVADGEDLARVAVDLGYATHSHFTSHFRSAFGVTPSELRLRARARS